MPYLGMVSLLKISAMQQNRICNFSPCSHVISKVMLTFTMLTLTQALDIEGAIPLSNSLSVTEQPRIEHTLRWASQSDSKHSTDTVPFRHGELVVLSV